MEREVWSRIVVLVMNTPCDEQSNRFTFGLRDIVLIFLWSVLHDRPISWACRKENWPNDIRPSSLPWPSTMTRRLRTTAFQDFTERLHRRLRGRFRRGWIHVVDGKPLPIGGNSTDPEAGYGRGAGGKAKGYKLHVISGKHGQIRSWAVHAIHVNEHKVAAKLVPMSDIQGYLLGDRNYDANHLYETCRSNEIQLVAPRRYGPGRGVGHHRHSPARLRAIDLLEHSTTGFGPQLIQERKQIERIFGNLSSASYGITALPPWVRRLHRVRQWISAKLVIFMLVRSKRKRAV
jgi:hypothetical protein